MLDFNHGLSRDKLIRALLTVVLVPIVVGLGGVALAAGETSTPVLSLSECIRLAVQDSPTLLISGERKTIAKQGVKDAYGGFLPNVSLSRTWSKSERTDFDSPQYAYEQGEWYSNYFNDDGQTARWYEAVRVENGLADETINATSKDWGARADLNLFSGFSKFTTLSSAKNTLKAADASQQYTRELVVESVITAYYNLLRYEELALVAVETRDQAARELERTETYFRLGSAAKSDVLQQRVRLENTKLDLVVADNTVKKAFADLAFAMNQPLAAIFRVDSSVLATDFPVEDLDSLYNEALGSRLDLVSSEYTLGARKKDIRTAEASLYPSVTLFGNYSRSDNESPYKFGSQLSSSTSYGYQVNWNIFDRLNSWTNRSRAKANARIAEYELEQARMNVQVEIRQLHNSLVEARERANVSRETIEQSAEELRLATERFRVGAGTTLDVIVAQTNLASARAQVVQAKCDYLIGKAMMDRAVGRLNSVASGS
jgi:outer membrane protein